MVEICTVGGYDEVGRNMTAVRYKDEVVIFDMGLHLENYIRYTNDEDLAIINVRELTKVEAVPDISLIEDWRKMVKAIIPTHAHLDHLGGIPFLAGKFNAPIICSPYTGAVLKRILDDQKTPFRNEIISIPSTSTFKISKNFTIEFVAITHSTPDSVMAFLHTPEGIVVYANDFKFDLYPTLGKKPDFDKLRKLGEKGILCAITDSTYAGDHIKMPSESVAKQLLKDVMLGTDSRNKAVIVTTFSSHIARLKSIVEFGKKMNRKIVFLGRSLSKYVFAAEDVNLVNFSKDVEIVKYRSQIKKRLKEIMKSGKEKYLLVVTGHQGEPRATLSRMIDGELNFNFSHDDHVVFSCKVIPTETNRRDREILEEKLRDRKVRIFKDIHVSGHAAREDLRQFIEILEPKNIIPAHGDPGKTGGMIALSEELGYKRGKNVFLMRNGGRIEINPK